MLATPRPAPLTMPSPAELGLGARNQSPEIDWADVRRRLQRLEITSFHLQKLPEGGFRFSCAVPMAGGTRKVEAEAIDEVDAIDRALTRAENLK